MISEELEVISCYLSLIIDIDDLKLKKLNSNLFVGRVTWILAESVFGFVGFVNWIRFGLELFWLCVLIWNSESVRIIVVLELWGCDDYEMLKLFGWCENLGRVVVMPVWLVVAVWVFVAVSHIVILWPWDCCVSIIWASGLNSWIWLTWLEEMTWVLDYCDYSFGIWEFGI